MHFSVTKSLLVANNRLLPDPIQWVTDPAVELADLRSGRIRSSLTVVHV